MNKSKVALILSVAIINVSCGSSIGKDDMAKCWAYEFISGDLASSRGDGKTAILHWNAKTAFQNLAEKKGLWDTEYFKKEASIQVGHLKSGTGKDDIKKIGAMCKKIVDTNKEWKAEFDAIPKLN